MRLLEKASNRETERCGTDVINIVKGRMSRTAGEDSGDTFIFVAGGITSKI